MLEVFSNLNDSMNSLRPEALSNPQAQLEAYWDEEWPLQKMSWYLLVSKGSRKPQQDTPLQVALTLLISARACSPPQRPRAARLTQMQAQSPLRSFQPPSPM